MARHDQTLRQVFQRPTRADLRWADVVALLKRLGAVVTAGRGSRVRFDLRGRTLTLHRPHPGNELPKYAVENVRRFLAECEGNEP